VTSCVGFSRPTIVELYTGVSRETVWCPVETMRVYQSDPYSANCEILQQ